jgi:hypothetical protein
MEVSSSVRELQDAHPAFIRKISTQIYDWILVDILISLVHDYEKFIGD